MHAHTCTDTREKQCFEGFQKIFPSKYPSLGSKRSRPLDKSSKGLIERQSQEIIRGGEWGGKERGEERREEAASAELMSKCLDREDSGLWKTLWGLLRQDVEH